jgi:putative membrane protein
MMHYYGGMGWIGWLIFFFFALLIAAAIVLFVYLISRSSSQRTRSNPPREEDALEILRRRYAKGDITKEQYDEMREHLSG